MLPDVPSTIVPPGFNRPARSASSIIFTAMRSLIELPGLNVSTFASTVPLTTPFVNRLMRIIGVSPIASSTVSQIFFRTGVGRAFQARPSSLYRGCGNEPVNEARRARTARREN